MSWIKYLIIGLAIIIVFVFLFIMESDYSFGNNLTFHHKGFLSDFVFCDVFGDCYQINAQSTINTTTFEPDCTTNNSVTCCTDINNYTTCRNSSGIDEFPEGDY